MAKRGRKSGASLATVKDVAALPQRPQAPNSLDERGQARWREIVDSLPADYWRPSDLVMLEDMLHTETMVRECNETARIEGQTMGDKVHPAVVARARHLATILSYQRALRLCPSQRLRRDAGVLNNSTRRKRPWE